jgi:antitoxin ParD1/3/4
MSRTHSTKFSISLPSEQAQQVQALADSGQYASVSAVISDGLRALEARNAAIERWLRDEVVPAYHALQADPSRGLSVDQLQAALAEHRRQKA